MEAITISRELIRVRKTSKEINRMSRMGHLASFRSQVQEMQIKCSPCYPKSIRTDLSTMITPCSFVQMFSDDISN